jgi:hypothetical protein
MQGVFFSALILPLIFKLQKECCVIKKMINIPPPKLGSFKSRPVPLLNLSIIAKNSINDSHMHLVTLKADSKTNCSKIINVQKPQLPKY